MDSSLCPFGVQKLASTNELRQSTGLQIDVCIIPTFKNLSTFQLRYMNLSYKTKKIQRTLLRTEQIVR